VQSKALLLQSGYGLSDPGLEKQLPLDLMSRRFIDQGLSEGVPDQQLDLAVPQHADQAGLAGHVAA
jgi:Transposase domain (DUF772)